MNPYIVRLRPVLMALILPVGGVAISYVTVFDNALRLKAIDVRAKFAKLSEATGKRAADHAANLHRLEQIEVAQSEIGQLVSTRPGTQVEAVPQVDMQLKNPPIESQVAKLSAVVALFAQHQVHCLASQPAEPSSEASDRKDQNRKEQNSKEQNSKDQKHSEARKMRVTLQGSFTDVHHALMDLQQLDGPSMVSLEMEASAPGDAGHRWVIILRS